MLILRELGPANRTQRLSQNWFSLAASGWDSRPGEMCILAHIWFCYLAACLLLSCHKAWNTHSGNALSSSVSAMRILWKHDCVFLMTEVVNSLGHLSSSAS